MKAAGGPCQVKLIDVELIGSARRIVGERDGIPSRVRTLTNSLAGPVPTLLMTETEIK